MSFGGTMRFGRYGIWALVVLVAVVVVGCAKDTTSGEQQRLSMLGHSCGRTADCELGLVCVAQVCVKEEAREQPDPAVGTGLTVPALAGVAVGKGVGEYLSAAKVVSARVQLEMVASALEMYYAYHDEYPETLGALVQGKRLLKSKNLGDPWQQSLHFERKGESFWLCSKGPDAVLGTDDDLCFGDEEGRAMVFGKEKEPECAVVQVTLACDAPGCAFALPVLETVAELHDVLLARPGIRKVASLPIILRRLHYVLGEKNEEFDTIPESASTIAQLMLVLEANGGGAVSALVDPSDRRSISVLEEFDRPSTLAQLALEGEVEKVVSKASLKGRFSVRLDSPDDCESARRSVDELGKLSTEIRLEDGNLTMH